MCTPRCPAAAPTGSAICLWARSRPDTMERITGHSRLFPQSQTSVRASPADMRLSLPRVPADRAAIHS